MQAVVSQSSAHVVYDWQPLTLHGPRGFPQGLCSKMADVTDLEEVYSKLICISRTSSSFLRETNVLISYLF